MPGNGGNESNDFQFGHNEEKRKLKWLVWDKCLHCMGANCATISKAEYIVREAQKLLTLATLEGSLVWIPNYLM